jgi:transporter family protein
MWIVFALLGALFASVTAILIKIGIEGVNSNLATAIRTVVVLVMAWGIVFATGKHTEIANITQKSWIFLTLSGAATGASWMFFYRALQMGQASKVIPVDKLSVVISIIFAFVILGEEVSAKAIIGAALIAIGTLIMVL